MKQDERRKVTGKIRVHPGGFGFVLAQEGDDLFIPSDAMHTALDGDTVTAQQVRTIPGKNPIGRVTEVVHREQQKIIGTFQSIPGGGRVLSDDARLPVPLFIPKELLEPKSRRTRAPKDKEVVSAELLRWKTGDAHPTGRILEVLGSSRDADIDVRIAARSRGFPLEFPRQAEEEAETLLKAKIRKEKRSREDLRSLTCITIDPDTARDFDDALSVEQLDSGLFEVGVHIADVSWYVRENSALDREAAKRGTSVYLVDHVIPMLPEVLSNDLCSLRPGEDRLAFSVMMTLNSRGDVCRYRIVETVIRSSCRLTYAEAEEIISGSPHRYARTVSTLMLLSQVLRRQREEMGSIDFDVSEPVLSLDEKGIPYEMKPRQRLDANRLVEEFMLLANRTVAGHMVKKKREHLPFIFRVHEQPKEQDMRSFLTVLETLGIHYRIDGALKSDDYRKILDIIENLDFRDFVEKVALRAMTKASYSTKNTGHFGLAFEAYTHFTSPIRRYPDLLVHRLLKQYARESSPGDLGELKRRMEHLCASSFERELQAVQAEREYVRTKAMQFLSRKVGSVCEGVISGVTSFGIFVELSGYLIDGLVHISTIPGDRYVYDKEAYQLKGENTSSVYRLGDRVKVKIVSVSVEERKAVFSLAE